MPQLSYVPNCHPVLAGIVRLRGSFVPVISLNPLVSTGSNSIAGPHEKLAVMRSTRSSGECQWAIKIADANPLCSLETLGMEETGENDAELCAVISTATYREDIVRILDPQRLYLQATKILNQAWNRPALSRVTIDRQYRIDGDSEVVL